LEAIKLAHNAIRVQINAINELAAMVPTSSPKRTYNHETHNPELKEQIFSFCYDRCAEVARSGNANKKARSEALKAIKADYKATLSEEEIAGAGNLISVYFHDVEKKAMRQVILNESKRLDGRGLRDIRAIWSEVDYLPSAHGSAIFTRGETQSLTTVTLGNKMDEQMIDGAVISGYNKFYLHYNIPGFSTGEVKPMRGPGRREVGHGNLALRSLKQMMPGNDYAYTVRVVSDILESNGSSSMATVCAGSLALMDAGVPIPKHVSGVAMGLITRPTDGKYAILTDILGDEDHLGDMDFKVTGTKDGICGIQMDIKIDGLSMETMMEALEQARKGRLHILDAMYEAMPAARAEVKPHAPRMQKLFIDKEFIGAVIGPQGKIIQEIQRETGTTINIEEIGNQGEVSVFSPAKEGLDRAVAWIKGIVAMPEVGEEYESKVKSIMPYGAFVEFMPGKQGLLHISEVSWKRLENLDGILKEGDTVKVKLVGIDHKTGKFKLSRKALIPKPDFNQAEGNNDNQN
jgi:polyribonucleotide nucleotidyltransferase